MFYDVVHLQNKKKPRRVSNVTLEAFCFFALHDDVKKISITVLRPSGL